MAHPTPRLASPWLPRAAGLLALLAAAACTPYTPPPSADAVNAPGIHFKNDIAVFSAVGVSGK